MVKSVSSLKWLSIPKDEDAAGIIVRTINHRYYLHLHTMRFMDPYIEVEYNISRRRSNVQMLSNICVCMLAFSCMVEYVNEYLTTIEMAMTGGIDPHFVTSIYAMTIGIIHLVIFGLIRVRYIAYVVDWCMVVVVLNLVGLFTYVYILHKAVAIALVACGDDFTAKYLVGAEILYRSLPMGICALNISYFYVLNVICTYQTTTFIGFIQSIVIVLLNASLFNGEWTTKDDLEPYIHNETSIANYTENQIDIKRYLGMQILLAISFWFVYLFISLIASRQNEIVRRENFIMKRVKSNKDSSQIDDTGIDIVSTASAKILVNQNISAVKQPSTESDPSRNITPNHYPTYHTYLVNSGDGRGSKDNDESDYEAVNLEIGESYAKFTNKVCGNVSETNDVFENDTEKDSECDRIILKDVLQDIVPSSGEYTKSVKSDYDPFASSIDA